MLSALSRMMLGLWGWCAATANSLRNRRLRFDADEPSLSLLRRPARSSTRQSQNNRHSCHKPAFRRTAHSSSPPGAGRNRRDSSRLRYSSTWTRPRRESAGLLRETRAAPCASLRLAKTLRRRRPAVQGGQSHFRGGQTRLHGNLPRAAKIGTVPSEGPSHYPPAAASHKMSRVCNLHFQGKNCRDPLPRRRPVQLRLGRAPSAGLRAQGAPCAAMPPAERSADEPLGRDLCKPPGTCTT